ncbi:MAG: hypothetical protein KIT15_12330 [Xanthobacteraceae bacterium]|nr:hypothetical protein [Xanthobacteraceae bacterium]MCW5675355.1 hypothetical protein [Xanthobacteraceae bacterium]MCW5676602.1 hypothetical protein [Xanthobacteraceae bacterium]
MVENFLLRIFRASAVVTAAVALLIAVLALVYGLYARYAPKPVVDVYARLEKLSDLLRPEIMLRQALVDDREVGLTIWTVEQLTKDVLRGPSLSSVPENSQQASLDEAFKSMNEFLLTAFSIRIGDRARFVETLTSPRFRFSWTNDIDPQKRMGDIWPAAFAFYAKWLAGHAKNVAGLTAENRIKVQQKLVDKSFIYEFYSTTMNNFLKSLASEYAERSLQHSVLRDSQWFAFQLMAASFGYFFLIMLAVVFIRIEVNLRRPVDQE